MALIFKMIPENIFFILARKRLSDLWIHLLNFNHYRFVPNSDRVERTVKLEASMVEIEERGVKLRLTVVDTPGYSDAINNNDWYVCIHVFLAVFWGT